MTPTSTTLPSVRYPNQRRHYERLKSKGLCTKCGQIPPEEGFLKCSNCRGKAKKVLKSWYTKNRASKNQRYCSVCGVATPANQILCDDHRWRNCEVCGKRFKTDRGATREVRYCSRRCTGNARNGIVPKGFVDFDYSKINRSGKDHPNWKGGISPESLRIRNSPQLREWRERVYQRDDWTCQDCGQRGGVLHAHHIKSFTHYPEFRTDINNGVTLCVPCHSARHGHTIPLLRFYGKEGNRQMKLFGRSS